MTAPTAAPDPAKPGAWQVLDDPVELRRFTRFETDAHGRQQAESALRITGMHCAACAGLIEQAVGAVPGVCEVSVSAAGERARVRWDPQRLRMAQVLAAIQAAGYGAVPDIAAEAREARRAERRQAIWRLFVAAFCAMQVMMLATPSYVTTGDELAPDMRQLLNWGSWLLALPVMVFSAGPFFSGAWRSLRSRRIGMDVPVALGVAVTFIASSGATFDPQGVFGREVYFDSLTMFISFLLGGRLLETLARHRVAQVLESALDGMPETALRVDAAGHTECVSVQRLVPGDRLRVPVGQAFAGDGRIEQGQTLADEALLTGESLPVTKREGDAVVAGSINRGAPVLVRLERVGADTRLEGIVALMREAMTQRPALARVADRWAGPFLWAVLVLAAGAAAVWSVLDPSRAVWVAVSVLIVTCPCALSLAAPAAMLSAASTLARRGVLLQRLDALESLTRLTQVFLDKTGTVTDERLSLAALHPMPGAPQAREAGWLDVGDGAGAGARAGDAAGRPTPLATVLQQRAASLAAWSSHPVARALATAAGGVATGHAAGLPADLPVDPPAGLGWQAVQEFTGQGLQALDAAGRRWRLGRDAFAAAVGAPAGPDASPATADAADMAAAAARLPAPAGPVLWLGCEGRLLARLDLDETLRPDAQATVRALQAQGLAVALLSGDQPARAQRMGALLGLADVRGGATPETKLQAVSEAQAAGAVVAMVGDGLNDAPVLARADVALAMGQGALVARAQADAVIASGRLADLLLLRQVATRTLAVVRQNLLWAAVYNAACIPLALAGWLPPWAAGLGMALSSLGVIVNALRLQRLPAAPPAAPAEPVGALTPA